VKLPKAHRLLRTTAVRIALRYAFVYAILVGIALAAFYWATGHYVDAQIRAGLREEFQMLHQRYATGGLEALSRMVASRSEAAQSEDRFYLLVDKGGRKLAGNLLGWPPEDPLPLDARVHVVWVEDDIIPGDHYRDDAFWPVIGLELPDGVRLAIARSMGQVEAFQMYSLYALLGLLIVLVSLAVTMGLFLGWHILKKIDGISHTARDIMEGDLSRRMPVSSRGDEFDELSDRLNRMLQRIETLLVGMREVTDNVAHDMRGPLTRLRNRLEVTLIERRDEAAYRDAMQQAVKDADSLVRTFNTALQVAQADAGTLRAAMEPVDIAALTRELGQLYSPAAEDAELQLAVSADERIMVRGNQDLLAQAVGNLLDNAIKYTPRGGNILLQACKTDSGVEIRVADSGPGIPPQQRSRVAERFIRLDAARHTPGNGLGLSLVDAIARQHGATLELRDNRPGLAAVLAFRRELQGVLSHPAYCESG